MPGSIAKHGHRDTDDLERGNRYTDLILLKVLMHVILSYLYVTNSYIAQIGYNR